MATMPLPPAGDLSALKGRLYGEHRIEVTCFQWRGRPFLRVSVQGYNTEADIETLMDALSALLPQVRA